MKTKLLLALCFAGCMANAQIIYPIIGSGVGGYSGDGGFAILAETEDIEDIRLDASGNIYFSDEGNNVIRKVNSVGIINTIIGNGTGGYSGDGGQATAAELSSPYGLALDASGNIYIADYNNNRVRKVIMSTGIINTIAGNGTAGHTGDGGQATAAELDNPIYLAFDGSGNLYFSDMGSNEVRKITTAGIISTFAGNGIQGFSGDGGQATAAELNLPANLAFDASGNLYIDDYANNAIRKVIVSTGIISTVAGEGPTHGGYNSDGIQATAAELNYPDGVAIDGSGNLYITDQLNNRIRKVIMSTGIISTYAGTGTSGNGPYEGSPTACAINGPTAGVFDASGNYYVMGSGRVLEISTKCPANAGPNVTNQQDDCGNWPGVQIGSPAVDEMTYVWTPSCHLNPGHLSSCAVAQPTSAWTNTTTPEIYTVTVSYTACTTVTSTVQVTALENTCSGCCRLAKPSTVGLTSITLPNNFTVYPNPSNSSITLSLYEVAENIRIVDMQGRTVFETQNADAGEFKLDISQYNKGIYFVMAKIGNTLEKQKLVVE
jgi:sugar lactone lactonase YvrE